MICAFEPFLEVIEYTIEHSEPSDKFKASLSRVVSMEKCRWSKRICVVIGMKLALFKPKDSFHEFLAKTGSAHPPNPSTKCKLWMFWDRIVYIALTRGVSLMDSLELLSICSELHQQQGATIGEVSVSPQAFVLADSIVNYQGGSLFQQTLIQEMKDYMKREQKWEVPLSGLTRLPTRFNQDFSKCQSPVLFSKGVLSFEPFGTVQLRPDEPVDSYVDRLIKWEDDNRQVARDKNLYFPPSGTLNWQQTKDARRFKIEQGLESWTRIHNSINELSLEKVIFVFDSYNNPQRTRYENWSGDLFRHRAMISRGEGKKKLVWARRTKDGLYRIKNTSLSDEELWAGYRSVQTIDLKQIELLDGRECDAVFFFGAKRIRKRWLQWCDACCGKQTRVILVGDISNSF